MSVFSTLAILFAFGLVISGIAYLGILEARIAAERMAAVPPTDMREKTVERGNTVSLANARRARAARMESVSSQKIAS